MPGLALICALLLAPAGAAAPPDSTRGGSAPYLRFRSLSTADGLSDDDVRSIVQDHQGFMWFGTEQGGLNRYDGYEFKTYQSDSQDERSLIHRYVWVLYEDRRGTLWVGTNGGGLDRYDRDTDSFVHYRHDRSDPASLPHDNVKSLYEDAAGVFWVGSDGGLSRFDRETGKFVTHRHDPADPLSLGDDSVRAILEDPATGSLWLATRRGGVSVLDRATGRFRHYRHDPDDRGTLSSDTVDHLFRDHLGAIWCATRGGLSRFDPLTGRFVRYAHDPRNASSLSDDYVSMVHEDARGRLWVATLNGLDLFDRGTESFLHYRHDGDDPDSLAENQVTALYEDDTGGMWIGTISAGVSRLAAGPPRFRTERHRPSDPRSLAPGTVQALCVDRTGTVWIGSSGGLSRSAGTAFTRWRHDPNDPKSLGADDVRAIAEDGRGGLWIGTWGGGLDHFDGRSFARHRADPRDPRSLSGDFIDALHLDPKGVLWIAVHGVGLDRFDGASFAHYQMKAGDPTSLPSRYVLSIAGDGGDSVWLGTAEMGLVRLDPRTGVFSSYLLDRRRPGSEAANRINDVYVDLGGALWLAADAGLFRFDPASGKITQRVTKDDGLAVTTVLAVQGDDRGRLWLGTAAGLSRYDPGQGSVRTYDRADGLQGNQFVPRARAKGKDGRMLFGGLKGLDTFDPAAMAVNPHVPPLVLTSLEVYDKPVRAAAKESPLRRAIHVADTITLRHDQSVFSVRFAALDYAAPARNRYAYKMEGFDPDWRYTGADRRFATYTNLDPGPYVFRVRGANNDGVWNESGAVVRIFIRPPWWKTWWFRLLAFLLVVGLAAGAYRLRIGTLAERERRFRTLAENAPDVVARFDAELRYRYVNPAAEEHVGRAPSAMIGRTNAELAIPGLDAAAVERALTRAFDTGEAAIYEFEFTTARGPRIFESRLVPEGARDGPTRSVLAITRDVTERKHAEKEQAQFQDSLRRSQTMAAMGALVAGVAHEVRNPLFAISSVLDSLEAQMSGESRFRRHIDVLKGEVKRMSSLMQELLAYGRPAAPQLSEDRIEAVIADALRACEAMAQGARVHLTRGVVSGLPLVSMERGRLLQVFQNLVENSIQYSPPGGTVSVEAATENGDAGVWLRCSIEDQGPGFREEDLPRVFEPFFTRRRGGTGLGLSIVQRIVEDHRGTIVAANRPGGGAVVVVRLPVTRG